MDEIARMQLDLRFREGEALLYYRHVWAIFSNSVFTSILDQETADVVADIRKKAKYYHPTEDLKRGELLEAIFRPVVLDAEDVSGKQSRNLAAYLLDLAGRFGIALKNAPGMVLELDFARQYYQDLNRLISKDMAVKPKTFVRLISQAEAARSVPFKGEPLKGLQVMGPLETRALDFDNLVILSCNEGVFPRHSVSSSFVPPELRKGFGLPTYEYQDSVWAYYFYRMIQRAKRVYMLYDSRTEGLRSGEESRYIKQLELHFRKKLNRVSVVSPIIEAPAPAPIINTEQDMQVLESMTFSSSSIQNYLQCPAKFYYAHVKELKKETDVEESLQANQIGNVLHKLMQQIYGVRGGIVTIDYLRDCASDRSGLKARIFSLIKQELNTPDVTGRNLVFANVILRYAVQILKRDCELLESQGSDRFKILSLETKDTVEICGRPFKGFIDRLDSLRDGTVRVSDYKTGKVTDREVSINDDTAADTADALFAPEVKDWPKIAFQLYVYDKVAQKNYPGYRIYNSIYPTVRLFKDEVPLMELSEVFLKEVDRRLEEVFSEIFDPEAEFSRTGDQGVCQYCDFKMLCGK